MFSPIPPAPDPPKPGEVPHSAASDPVTAEIHAYVIDCLNHGSKPSDIRTSLMAKGLSPAEANRVVQSAVHRQTGGAFGDDADISDVAALQAIGRRNMAIGGLVCVIGLVVTLGSMAAAGDGGGRFVIAWGAIVWGAVQFFRGMNQTNIGRN